MQRPQIDLRSDTVTKPTSAMRRAMAEAEVGDDVYGEDPTIQALEERTADLLGKEAAVFVPSGTMANQIGVGVNTQPGDEVLCSSTSHVYVWEAGGMARLSGVTARTFAGDAGLLTLDELRDAIRPDDPHYVRTRLVCLENTHNRGGGRVHPFEDVAGLARWARGHNLLMHLDGARLMNAVVASGRPAREWGAAFRTRSRSASPRAQGKAGGLGPGRHGRGDPQNARLRRALLGGGMRRAGMPLHAAALHAAPNTTSTAWKTITPTLGCSARPSPRPRDSRWNRGRSRRTWSGSWSTDRWGRPPRSPHICGRTASWSACSGRRSCGPAPTSTSPASRPNTRPDSSARSSRR